ncbi:DUF418 domain-containing protein [uncultured Sphingomonas sp.]|uniref:DUF418 domain-containing protein n=1 Tax=uncultured Sphingomonas sp. TaxID=158754 RepID=UPI0030DAB595
MTATTDPVARPAPRIAQLDIIRGLAVMGILVANLPAFALPAAAYFSPLAWGGTGVADRIAWFVTFVLVEGKMRGLFSMLFGASMLLVMDRAAAGGRSPAAVHLARMAALFAIGLVHLYLIWWGDILAHYALVGTVALAFARARIRLLLFMSGVLLLIDLVLATSVAAMLVATPSPATGSMVAAVVRGFGVPPQAELIAEVDAYRTSFVTATRFRLAHAGTPLDGLYVFGLQTLSAMLLGMAAFRSGFLTGGWSRATYRRIALIALGTTLPLYTLLAWHSMAGGFGYRRIFLASIVLGPVLRPVTTVGYAALALAAVRGDGRWSARIAAVGRAAFSNYIGTSLAMLLLFTGAHRFGTLSRAQLYVLAPPIWAFMLWWSPWWLRHFGQGPLERVWRSIADAPWQMRTRRN